MFFTRCQIYVNTVNIEIVKDANLITYLKEIYDRNATFAQFSMSPGQILNKQIY